MLIDRLIEKMEVVDGCWEWTACRNRKGYGVILVDKVGRLAHRISYSLHRGEIPAGLHVLHHCDNPRCINPEHLFLGTDLDNAADRDSKGRGARFLGEAHGNAKLTGADVAAIRAAKDLSDRKLAKLWGVSKGHIYRIRSGQQWAHL